ncbi:hypothetical protein [Pusillimonas noertemannii]|nr:hypothetical protein [Pusillimonas noertemannii]NYT68804.1 hypothetical protein [Pusillimonas noertemannii]TFL10840.1 hypothetical protein CSC72_10030 [Pusillimonas noertemannii]
MEIGLMPGRYPAIVRSYDADRRTCRVEIPGLTDGGDVLPEAEIEYSIGDKSRAGANTTEIEITPGDPIWVAFIGGDPRYPIITGYRNPQAGNSTGWRRWHHANMELLAETLMRMIAGGDFLIKSGTHVIVQAPSATIDAADTHVKGNMLVDGAIVGKGGMAVSGGSGVSVEGNIGVKGNVNATGDILADGANSNHHSH